jgi:hypothetical protein
MVLLYGCGGSPGPSGDGGAGSIGWLNLIGDLSDKRESLANTPGFLDNTEFAAEPWRASPDRGRGWATLGLCTVDGWASKSPFLGVPSCLEPWAFPLPTVALGNLWVKDVHSLGGRQIALLKRGDVVVIHEVWVDVTLMDSYMAPLMAEIDFPKVRREATNSAPVRPGRRRR